MEFALTYHVEGPRERPSGKIYDEVAEQVILADRLGFDVAWFSEHHAHVHLGHAPFPLLLALHLAARTERIHLGTAVICLNLHHPLAVAEQVAMADVLTGGRISPGFGSGSTPPEYALFNLKPGDAAWRHARFAEALDLMLAAWSGRVPAWNGDWFTVPAHAPLPIPAPDLPRRVWIAANSPEAAAIAGARGLGLMLSRERSVEQYRTLIAAYHAPATRAQDSQDERDRRDGEERERSSQRPVVPQSPSLPHPVHPAHPVHPVSRSPRISVSRSVYVGRDDAAAQEEAGPALWALWRRMQREGKAPADAPDPENFAALAQRTSFIAGSAAACRREIEALQAQVPFTNFNLQPRWEGLDHRLILESLRRFAAEVMPALKGAGE